jgi:hypothetical protein
MDEQMRPTLTLALLLLASCRSPASSPSGPSVLRVVAVHGGTIELGRALPAALAGAPGDTVVSLAIGESDDTPRIRAHLTPDGRVRMVWFDYAQRVEHARLVRQYVALLGAPRREPYRLGERLTWEDGDTRFEIVRDPERSASTVFGVLTDLR